MILTNASMTGRWAGHVKRTAEDYTREHGGRIVNGREIIRCVGTYTGPNGGPRQVWEVRCRCGQVSEIKTSGVSGIKATCRGCQARAGERGSAEYSAEREALHDLLRSIGDECPEVWRADTRESVDACVELADLLRAGGIDVGFAVIGSLLGVSRQRIEQNEQNALRRCRLRGGKELRESWEHVQARTDITWAEATDLIAWATDDDSE